MRKPDTNLKLSVLHPLHFNRWTSVKKKIKLLGQKLKNQVFYLEQTQEYITVYCFASLVADFFWKADRGDLLQDKFSCQLFYQNLL